MEDDQLDMLEQTLMTNLPGPPVMGQIRTTNLWIIEWLSTQDRRTGRFLHEWLEERRPGWSAYFPCSSKADVLASVERATIRAQQTNMIPILHLEAHGNEVGLEGPNGKGGNEPLRWEELTEPLQRLNLATKCNLLIFIAACTGFAGIKAFHKGPRAPAVALVGPNFPVNESNLLLGTKEFYRRLMDPNPALTDMTESASREAGSVEFEPEPFAVLAFESTIKALHRVAHSIEETRRLKWLREQVPALQLAWDQLFMIDLWPENRARFGVDMAAVIDALSKKPEFIVLSRP